MCNYITINILHIISVYILMYSHVIIFFLLKGTIVVILRYTTQPPTFISPTTGSTENSQLSAFTGRQPFCPSVYTISRVKPNPMTDQHKWIKAWHPCNHCDTPADTPQFQGCPLAWFAQVLIVIVPQSNISFCPAQLSPLPWQVPVLTELRSSQWFTPAHLSFRAGFLGDQTWNNFYQTD